MYSYEPSGREIFLKIWTSDALKVKRKIEHNTAIKHCPSMSTWLGYQVTEALRVPPRQSELTAPGWLRAVSQHTAFIRNAARGAVLETNSPGICSHFLIFFLIFVVLIISLGNGTVRHYYLPVKHTYQTALLLSCKLCEIFSTVTRYVNFWTEIEDLLLV